jgi:hypothetical protein
MNLNKELEEEISIIPVAVATDICNIRLYMLLGDQILSL